MKVNIKVDLELITPKGTTVISNDDWVTLGRLTSNGSIALTTHHVDDIANIDLLDEDNWNIFTKDELEKALKLKK